MRTMIGCLAWVLAGGLGLNAQAKEEISGPTRAKLEARLKAEKEAAQRNPPPRVTSMRLPSDPNKSPTAIQIDPADRNLSPEELRKKYKERLGAKFVGIRTQVLPAQVAPGGTGTLTVTMAMREGAVLPPSEKNKIDLAAQQGVVSLGAPTWRPATAASAPAVRGKQIYDKTAVFDIPFAVDQAAVSGRQVVEMAITYELYDGTTGGWIERFLDHVRAEIVIVADAPEIAEPAIAPPPPANAVVDPAAVPAVAAAAADPEPQAAQPQVVELAADGLPMWVIVLCAGLVAAIVGVAALRRR